MPLKRRGTSGLRVGCAMLGLVCNVPTLATREGQVTYKVVASSSTESRGCRESS